MNPIAMSALADERIRDMHASAAHSRLIALARCCQPSAWAHATTRAHAALTATAEWVRRGQLGPSGNYCACP